MKTNPSGQFEQLFRDYRVDTSILPESLQELIKRFHRVVDVFDKADEKTRQRLFPILSNTAAVIAAEVERYKPDRDARLKMLELEARARARKQSMN